MVAKACAAVAMTFVLLLSFAPAWTVARTNPVGGGPFQAQSSLRRLPTYTTDAGNCQVDTHADQLNCGSSTPACCQGSTCYYNPTGATVARLASQESSSSSSSASASSSSSDSDGESSSSSAASSSSSSSSGESSGPGVCSDGFYLGCC